MADLWNSRIMRWSSETNEGSIIVGGKGPGQCPNQFNYLSDLLFDRYGNLYIVD